MRPVPGVELGLQAVALGQQRDVAWGQVVDDAVEACPELVGVYAGTRQHFVLDETQQRRGDLELVAGGAVGHGNGFLGR